MKKLLFPIIAMFFAMHISAQYDPSAINYGLVAIKSFGFTNEVGLGARMEYAPNCYTTYMGEYNRLFSIGADEEVEGYNELALGVNLILFNWYPTTITAGMGYVGNDSSVFEDIEDDAFIAFRTGNFNHGAQIKLRALHQISIPVHIFAELNIKSLGRRYDTFLIGFSYDFEAR
ncbi:hypothetical protein [Aquimarina sp. MMG016]|uniref:hypothetical protein n=1 Tax=Aquimarina sp. MMG016 TaxID=2822690 RepID=UPI001B3A3E46|nr:hypothetical protein [Aquimarina sp. MMG016]MBQ4820361.1 hypothetical protein [Aquimarina sp. MMG016]